MIRIVHPGSGCWLSTHPGSRIQGSKRHRIPDPQHCLSARSHPLGWLIVQDLQPSSLTMMSTLCPPEDLVTPPRSPLTPSPGFSLLPSIESGGGGLGGGPSIESGGGGFPSLLLHHSSARIPIPGAAGGPVDVSSAAAASGESESASGGVNGVNRCCRGATTTAAAATATLPEECEVEEEEGSSDEVAARERVQVGFLTKQKNLFYKRSGTNFCYFCQCRGSVTYWCRSADPYL